MPLLASTPNFVSNRLHIYDLAGDNELEPERLDSGPLGPVWRVLASVATVALLALAALDGSFAARPSPGCGNTPKLVSSGSTSNALAMTVNGKTRHYCVKLPDVHDKNHPYRVICKLHALGGNAGQVVAGTGGYYAWYSLPPLVNVTVDAIYVAPSGRNNGRANQGGEDITFISQLVQTIEADCYLCKVRISFPFLKDLLQSASMAGIAKIFKPKQLASGESPAFVPPLHRIGLFDRTI
ncbi:hypothetical protein DL768_010090 [Monosporascus sp. mg162]|nr:hypothetical protein DL768_010090 [Monosporascus sp. mg162]